MPQPGAEVPAGFSADSLDRSKRLCGWNGNVRRPGVNQPGAETDAAPTPFFPTRRKCVGPAGLGRNSRSSLINAL